MQLWRAQRRVLCRGKGNAQKAGTVLTCSREEIRPLWLEIISTEESMWAVTEKTKHRIQILSCLVYSQTVLSSQDLQKQRVMWPELWDALWKKWWEQIKNGGRRSSWLMQYSRKECLAWTKVKEEGKWSGLRFYVGGGATGLGGRGWGRGVKMTWFLVSVTEKDWRKKVRNLLLGIIIHKVN